MQLEKEYNYFLSVLPQLLENPENIGKFVLISDDKVAGIYNTKPEAYHQGYKQFGLGSFLIKEIVENEPAIYFSRNIRCQA